MMRKDHHSPTTSKAWATEHCMSSKLVRRMKRVYASGLHDATHWRTVGCMKEPTTTRTDRRARRWRTRGIDPRIRDELQVIAEHHQGRDDTARSISQT